MHEEESEIWHKEGFLYTHIYTRKRHTMKKRDWTSLECHPKQRVQSAWSHTSLSSELCTGYETNNKWQSEWIATACDALKSKDKVRQLDLSGVRSERLLPRPILGPWLRTSRLIEHTARQIEHRRHYGTELCSSCTCIWAACEESLILEYNDLYKRKKQSYHKKRVVWYWAPFWTSFIWLYTHIVYIIRA